MATKRPVTKRPKTDFISFILDAERSKKLAEEWMKQDSAPELHGFFQKKGYTGIRLDDCGDILEARRRWEELTSPGHGKPPCEGKNKGY